MVRDGARAPPHHEASTLKARDGRPQIYHRKSRHRRDIVARRATSAFDSMMSGEATPPQMGGLLMALRVRGATVDESTGPVTAMPAMNLRLTAPAEAVDAS